MPRLIEIRAAAQAARRRRPVQRRDRGRATGTGRGLQGARRPLPGRNHRAAGRAVHRRGPDHLHLALPQSAHPGGGRRRPGRARSPVCRCRVQTMAEAVGSDVTNVVRSCVAEDRFGAAAQVLSAYLDNDAPVAVSEYTRQLIIAAAEETDAPLRHPVRCPVPGAGRRSRTRRSTPPSSSIRIRAARRGVDRARAEAGRLRALPVPAGPCQGRRRSDPRLRGLPGGGEIGPWSSPATVPRRSICIGSPRRRRRRTGSGSCTTWTTTSGRL